MVGRASASSFAALCALFAATAARADDAPRLEYVLDGAVPGCPTEREFRDAVATRLGREPFAEVSARRLRVEVRLEGGELTASGALIDADGAAAGLRRFAGKPDGCREVVEGLALAVSLALGDVLGETAGPPPPASGAAEAERSPSPAPLAPVPAAVPPRTAPPASPAPTVEGASSDVHLVLGGGLAGHATFGVGPGVGVGGSLVATGRLAPWSVSLEGRIDGFSYAPFDTGGGVTTSLVAGVVAPCRYFGLVPLCLVGLAGSIRAVSTGVAAPGSDSAPYAAAGGRLGLDWPVSDLLLFQIRLDALVTLLPVDIDFAGQTVWSSSPFSAALGAGVTGLFP